LAQDEARRVTEHTIPEAATRGAVDLVTGGVARPIALIVQQRPAALPATNGWTKTEESLLSHLRQYARRFLIAC
jgi:hypothetical protein